MSAIVKIFSDAACTQELATDGSGNYTLFVGPDTGIDGNAGETVVKQLWMKNAGDEIYQGVSLLEITDTPNRVTYSKDNTTYAQTLSFGDIAVNAVVTFYTKVVVAASSTQGRYNFSFKFDGQSI